MLTSLAGTIETLFTGWELVGLSSALLVAYFQNRPAPVRNGLRVWIVYRISDAAHWGYRERFLREKLGEAMTVPAAPVLEAGEEAGPIEESIGLLEILESEGIDTAGGDQGDGITAAS